MFSSNRLEYQTIAPERYSEVALLFSQSAKGLQRASESTRVFSNRENGCECLTAHGRML